MEAQEQAKKDKEAAQAATPDYAAAFMSPASVKPATTTNPLDKLDEPSVPSYAPAATTSKPNKPTSSLLKGFGRLIVLSNHTWISLKLWSGPLMRVQDA